MFNELFTVACVAFSISAQLESGKAIPVGAPDGVGPLATPSIVCRPMGCAYVYNAEQPDIFVAGDHRYTFLHLYRWIKTSPDGIPIFGEPIDIKVPFSCRNVPQGTIFQTEDAVIHGVWLQEKELVQQAM